MSAWRDLQAAATLAAREQIVDVLFRSGEAWIVRGPDNQPLPTLAEMGLGRLPLSWPRFVGVLGRDPVQLDLASFASRVAGTVSRRALSEADLERGFNVLTGGRDCRPTTLVLDAAERLTPEVIHYIQFAVISRPALQVIFVTTKEFRDRLMEFPVLYARLQPDLVVDAHTIQHPATLQTLAGDSEWNRKGGLVPQNTRQHEAECLQGGDHQSGHGCQIDELEECCASPLCVEPGAAVDPERQES